MRKSPAVDETLDQTGFAELRIVRPEAKTLVVARDRDDAAIVEHIGHAKIVHQAVVIEFTALRRTHIARIGAGMSRNYPSLINNGRANPESGGEDRAGQKQTFGKKGSRCRQTNEKDKDE